METFNPIPSVIEDIMENGTLRDLGKYVNPGFYGAALYQYQCNFFKILEKHHIDTYSKLKAEYDKIRDKKSNLSSNDRAVVGMMLAVFDKELSDAKTLWNTLSENSKKLAIEIGYHKTL